MDERRMTMLEHLEELRRVLIVSLVAWVVCTAAAFIFSRWLLQLLLHPLALVLPKNNHLLGQAGVIAIYTSPTEGLTIPLKIAAICGFIVALPVILWQLWTFVAPGLRPRERKFTGPFIASALLLFAIGGAFAYFVMPIGLNFLVGFLDGTATYFPDIDEYLSFFLLLILVFGITFELPIVVVLLGLLGIVSSKRLRARRAAIWVAIVIVACLVTPGADPFTPTALAIPLLILFELSILVLDKALHR